MILPALTLCACVYLGVLPLLCVSEPLDVSQADDDQHDYDSVASDEDTDSEITAQNNTNAQRNNRAKVSSSACTYCKSAGRTMVQSEAQEKRKGLYFVLGFELYVKQWDISQTYLNTVLNILLDKYLKVLQTKLQQGYWYRDMFCPALIKKKVWICFKHPSWVPA